MTPDLQLTQSRDSKVLGQDVEAPPAITIGDYELKAVNHFTYLGSTASNNLSLDKEIDKRIGKAATTLARLTTRVWENPKLSVKTKMAVYNACVLSTLLYGSETWSTYAKQENRLNAFHMRCMRRILGISWKDKVTNTEVLSRAGLPTMFTLLRQRRLRWLGHVRRMEDGRIAKDLLYGELISGKRRTGRPQLRFKDVCKRDLKALDIDTEHWEDLASDRSRWRCTLFRQLKSGEVRLMHSAEEKQIRRKELCNRTESAYRCVGSTAPANMAEGSGSDALSVPKPGFFHLDLFVKDTKDVSPWYDELKARLDQETGPMESAMTNLLGVFAFYKLRGQGKARKLLEGLTKRGENNLNAIANKQFIYGHLMRAKDEMACRDRLQELLSEDSDAARVRNARCFAEQAYALAFDVRDDSKDMVTKLLEMAKADAIASCEGTSTPFNIYHLGKVCHRLAVHPVTEEVEDWDELGDALDHFAQALQLEDGYTNPRTQAARGKSLEVAGEHEKAAESYKRAVENDSDKASYTWNFSGVLRNLLTLHMTGHGEHYIAEIAFWIKEGYKKYTDITPVLRHCVVKFESQMTQVCQCLIDCGDSQLARICLKYFGRHNSACRKRVASIRSKLPKEDASGTSGLDGPSSAQSEQETHVKVPVTVEKPRHGQEFQYDFFVSHSSKDAGWVNHALLPALEVDMRFKGCVADRDFLPGKSVFDNIIHSIENSYKTLLILTPNFVTSEWCKYETEHALYESLRGKSGRVIPIMLDKCDVPASLHTITYFDVSGDVIGSYDWLKLKKALEQTPLTED
ncbi:TLR1 [Branchiostoma lanceolatum]|uniref:TLR1 protein n=1 Tax=Branchiostoma lanceolatum TaxID=7740 RepID=A0A8K0A618_BRALA|nr:TLR1 [Branchiostoma lanceolatum]